MKTSYRVAVGLAVLVAMVMLSSWASSGYAGLWPEVDAGSTLGQGSEVSTLGQGGDAGASGPVIRDSYGLLAGYVDLRAATDRSHEEHSDAGGIVGVLVNHDVAVAVTVLLLAVAIGAGIIHRYLRNTHAGTAGNT